MNSDEASQTNADKANQMNSDKASPTNRDGAIQMNSDKETPSEINEGKMRRRGKTFEQREKPKIDDRLPFVQQ
jgi:hypothetical protein